jgi:hypothetical protein
MSILSQIESQMNQILSLMENISKSYTERRSSNFIFFENKSINSILSTSKTNNQNMNSSNNSSLVLEDNQNHLITSQNFLFSHLCNRDVDFILFYRFFKENVILRYVIYHYYKEILMISIVFVHVIY